MPGFVFADDDKCNRCGLCIPKCPVDAISSVRDRIVVDPQRCDGCGKCFKVCPEVAFRLTDDLKAVLWVLASGGQVSRALDLAFAQALPGVDEDRITKAAGLLLSWESRETKKSHDSMQNPIIAYSI
ncbi:MAG TPA: 4Fe-4S binding protein, partial [Firmicutes bacterium]|nr:4Fe-4S binding protein [Bacillota bacterium]